MNSLKVLRNEIICCFNEEDTNNGSNTDRDDLVDTYAAKLNNEKVKSIISTANNTSGIVNIVFSKTNPNIVNATPIIVSDDPTDTYPGKAYAIMDDTTLYIYPEVDNNKMYAPENCSNLCSSSSFTAYKFINIEFNNFDTSNTTNMYNMFAFISKLVSIINLDKFNTSKVTDMRGMFAQCKALTKLDLSNFNISSTTDVGNILFMCKALTTLYVKDENAKTMIANSTNFPSTCNIIIGKPE